MVCGGGWGLGPATGMHAGLIVWRYMPKLLALEGSPTRASAAALSLR